MALRAISVLLVLLLVQSCKTELEPTSIRDVKLCTEIVDGECKQDAPYFSPYTNTFYVSCILENATDDSVVKFFWYYYKDGKKELLDKLILKPRDFSTSKSLEYQLVANLNRNNSIWKEGRYEVEVVLEAGSSYFITRSFTI